MPLVDHRPPPSPLNINPFRLAWVLPTALLVFIVGLAITARLTADEAPAPRQLLGHQGDRADHDAARSSISTDAGVDERRNAGNAGDAGDPGDPGDDDAGVVPPVVTVSVSVDAGMPVDAGPIMVPGPPFPPAAVIGAAVVVVEACAGDALRWDPSLGGPFVLEVDLGPLFADDDGAAPPRVSTPGLLSPVLSSCLQRRAGDIVLPPLGDVEVPLSVHARATLGAGGSIAWSDAIVTLSKAERMNRGPPSE